MVLRNVSLLTHVRRVLERRSLDPVLLVTRPGIREERGRIGTREVIPGSAPSGRVDLLTMP